MGCSVSTPTLVGSYVGTDVPPSPTGTVSTEPPPPASTEGTGVAKLTIVGDSEGASEGEADDGAAEGSDEGEGEGIFVNTSVITR